MSYIDLSINFDKYICISCMLTMFLKIFKVAREELSRECDYELEAANQRRFRNLLAGTEGFYVPIVVDDISRKRVLTTELVSGNYYICHWFLGHILLVFPFLNGTS